MEANIQILADFVAKLPDFPEFMMSVGMVLLFAHGVKAGQAFWGVVNGH
jgi:hypothetical protein